MAVFHIPMRVQRRIIRVSSFRDIVNGCDSYCCLINGRNNCSRYSTIEVLCMFLYVSSVSEFMDIFRLCLCVCACE